MQWTMITKHFSKVTEWYAWLVADGVSDPTDKFI